MAESKDNKQYKYRTEIQQVSRVFSYHVSLSLPYFPFVRGSLCEHLGFGVNTSAIHLFTTSTSYRFEHDGMMDCEGMSFDTTPCSYGAVNRLGCHAMEASRNKWEIQYHNVERQTIISNRRYPSCQLVVSPG